MTGRKIERTSNIGPRYPCSMLGFWSTSPCSADMISQLLRPKNRCRIRSEGLRVVSFCHPANRRCGRFAAEDWETPHWVRRLVWVRRGGQCTRRRLGGLQHLRALLTKRGGGQSFALSLWMSCSLAAKGDRRVPTHTLQGVV